MTWPNFIFVCLVCFAVLVTSCNPTKSLSTGVSSEIYEFPYDMSQVRVLDLDGQLEEISGLCFEIRTRSLIAVEDETGALYFLDQADGAIIKKDSVYKPGDYEGVTNSENHYYILKSSGTVYQFDKNDLTQKPTKFKSPLSKGYDCEGLYFNKNANSLLISIKESPKEGTEDHNNRNIYEYDIASSKMRPEPFLTITRDELVTFINSRYSEEYANKNFGKLIDPSRDHMHLGPSGIALHPKTRNIYILSSRGKVLLVYDGERKALIDVIKLDKNIMPQPEGICFDDQGRMYIASEGKKGPPHLIIAAPKKGL